MVKNESDVIELFMRINRRWADHFYVIENGSSDTTPEILRRLAEEGMPITVETNEAIHFNQGRLTTALARRVAALDEYDYIFPIDCDEFIADPLAFKESLATVSGERIGALEWSTLVPDDGSAMERAAPLYDGFSKKRKELRRFKKVILPNSVARDAVIDVGNHGATGKNGRPLEQTPLPLPLFHAPVRSKEQIIAKILLAAHRNSINETRRKGESFHVDLIRESIRSNGFELSDEHLREIAFRYCLYVNDPTDRETESQSVGLPSDVRKYADLARVNVLLLIDDFMARLCEDIRRRPLSALRRKLYATLYRS